MLVFPHQKQYEKRYLSIGSQDIYVPPLRYNFSNYLPKRSGIRDDLILRVENGDFCDIGLAWISRASDIIPDSSRRSRRGRDERWGNDNQIVEVSVDRGFTTCVSIIINNWVLAD